LMLAALAVADVADAYGIDAGIKWPNDVQVAGKKLAGVIAESITGPESGDDRSVIRDVDQELPDQNEKSDRITAVIGIGLNVNFDPANDLARAPDATSMAVELNRKIDRLAVFEALMRSLDTHYSTITAGGTVVPTWREKLTTLGREVTVVGGKPGSKTSLQGLAHDIDSIGRLIVRDANGRDWPVSAGEVTVKDIR
jgi:BirA family biotin operon repressor/biotin-[acetyl-CoA-carboxylase] ligase